MVSVCLPSEALLQHLPPYLGFSYFGQAAAAGALSAAERSHPTPKVRGRSQEDPMLKGRWPRGVTPRPRSEAAAESTRLRWHRNGREELPHVRGQGGRLRGDTQCLRSGAATRGVILRLRSGAVARRSYPTPLSLRPGAAARRSNPLPRPGAMSQEDQPHIQGAVAVRPQEGLE